MKSILMSIQPRHVANILNGLKTIDIRKRFPKDYRGWVYIYCTKDKEYLIDYKNEPHRFCLTPTDDLSLLKEGKTILLNGKVVARFYCDNVEEIEFEYDRFKNEQLFIKHKDILEKSCLSLDELGNYVKCCKKFYAINITKLEIFDEPKELSKFALYGYEWFVPVERAPQNYLYVE